MPNFAFFRKYMFKDHLVVETYEIQKTFCPFQKPDSWPPKFGFSYPDYWTDVRVLV